MNWPNAAERLPHEIEAFLYRLTPIAPQKANRNKTVQIPAMNVAPPSRRGFAHRLGAGFI